MRGPGQVMTGFERQPDFASPTLARPARQLRELLRRDQTLVAAGAFSPMAAKLVDQAGFDAVYMPGGGVALDRFGVADLGLITMSEIIESATAPAFRSSPR